MILFQHFLTLLLLVSLKQNVQSSEVCRLYEGILNCSHQGLTHVPDNLFSYDSVEIILGGNDFECDCELSWFLDSIKDPYKRDRIIDLDNITCASPERLRFKKIEDLNEDDVCAATTETATEYVTEHTPYREDPCEPGRELTPKCDLRTEICVPREEHRYRCDCKQGFDRNPETELCEAVDACLGRNNCSKHAYCINKIGSYKCICNSGYVGNGIHCEDNNECEKKDTNDCHKHAVCINEEGGYRCRCKSGFQQYKEGRVCIRKNDVSPKTVILAALIAGIPFLTFVALTLYLCKRHFRNKMLARQAGYSPENPPNDDVMPPDNQQLIPNVGSFYEECIPMKRLPPSESAWSEWPDYDETKGSDSD